MSILLAEKILLDKFKLEPFHNLYLLNNIEPKNFYNGGTCSDKTLSYLSGARKNNLEAYLHTARIGGLNIHRLIRLEINNQRYFADVGNGWPSIQLYPAFKNVNYKAYGMVFRTEINDDVITVYHTKCGIEKKQMEIYIKKQSEQEIYTDISNRYSGSIVYPFSKNLRFSMIVGQRFMFIRGNTLEIYNTNKYQEIPNININRLKDVIFENFNYDIEQFI